MTVRGIRSPSGEMRRLVREESGVALLMTLAVFLLLYILCCGVYATGETIRQKTELQNACDAAAYSAAVVQADALSRMAVVNRAMAWTYVQLCRQQMDYITYSWLWLTCDRFKWDRANKAKLGKIGDKRHYTFKDFYFDIGPYGAGLRHYGSDKHKDWWYIGVGDGQWGRIKRDCVALNGRNGPEDAVPVEAIEGFLGDVNEQARSVYAGAGFREGTKKLIEQEKMLIGALNFTLVEINRHLHESLPATVQYVLFNNLQRSSKGQLDEEDVRDMYWMTAGGLSPNPEAYSDVLPPTKEGEDPGGSYFSGLGNTEGDELQFLTMADGIPGRAAGAPGWMKGRPVRLSDYFGTEGMGTVEDSDGKTVYMAGGLDQWYVRGTETEAESGRLSVPKDFRDPPGGIMRTYKHTNREEGATKKLGKKFHRPNHILSLDGKRMFGANAILGDFQSFFNPFAGGVNSSVSGLANALVQQVMGALQGALGGLGGVIGQLGGLDSDLFSADILPSDRHLPADFPDQCLHVSSSTGLVAQYEWSSAYWMCPWVKWTTWTGTKIKRFGCHRVPVGALAGCDAHGYEPWVSKEISVMGKGGATREEYRSCFINFDDLQDAEKNHYLKGYARVYGDDAEIFDEECYVGALACPWVLAEPFFGGDGTILVGLARKQKNPFLRLLGAGGGVGIYEPFSPKAGADRYVVALSAARAAWAPRPDVPTTGMESMNGSGTPRPPGNYEPRFDGVTEHKLGFACACGKEDTQERLLRMWNLSQTDWDGTLLPLRHAFDGHLPYDSRTNLKDGSMWEYENARTNAVVRLAGLLGNVRWANAVTLLESQMPGNLSPEGEAILRQGRTLSSGEILSVSQGAMYQVLLYRRLL